MVTIENLSWQECLSRYDKPETLLFLDPPYFGNENDYGKGLFRRQDFEEMAEKLSRLKGKFLLTMNDCPETRQLFGKFKVEVVTIKYQILHKNKDVNQLIISDA